MELSFLLVSGVTIPSDDDVVPEDEETEELSSAELELFAETVAVPIRWSS